jgi:uncharacterized protein YbaA (DUF1428 family)
VIEVPTANKQKFIDHAKLDDSVWMKNSEKVDPRMHPENNPMPFDSMRLIRGGFVPLVELVNSRSKGA